MNAQRFNKASAAAIAGAVVTILGSYFALSTELSGALQTVIAAGLVYAVANKG